MRKFIGLLVFTLFTAQSILFATEVDINDDLLIAYYLSAAEEAEFKLDDGIASSFWDKWSNRDRIEMNVNDHWNSSSASFDGPEDASLNLRVAFSDKGLCLYAKVTDNVWVTPTSFSDLLCDVVDIYFDSRTREEIKNTPSEDMATYWKNAISKTTLQFFVWMGSNSVNYSYYDEVLGWVGMESLGGLNVISLEDAQEKYDGMGMEIIEVDGTTRIQEWFIPWSQLGNIDVTNLPAEGKLIGFAGGYNDKDDAAAEQPSKLRWTKYDPWSQGPRENPDDPRSPVVTVGACECPEHSIMGWGHILLTKETIGVNGFFSSTTRNAHFNSDVVTTGYYTLQGKKIPAKLLSNYSANAIVIERHLLRNGTTITNKIQGK
jgi:hypothetical protein